MESYVVRPGKYLVFNHKEFEGLPTRDGSEFDVEAICATFDRLNFEGKVYNDLTSVEVKNELFDAFQDDFTDFGSLIVFILSHGDKDNKILAFDKIYNLEKYINKVMEHQSSTLIGKPKAFIIQACRGEEADKGVGFGGTEESKKSYYKQPKFPDLLLAYAGPNGYVSFRNSKRGSYFIQNLCQTVNDPRYKFHDMETILKVARQKITNETIVFEKKGEEKHCKQIPLVVTTLLKEFHLISAPN